MENNVEWMKGKGPAVGERVKNNKNYNGAPALILQSK